MMKYRNTIKYLGLSTLLLLAACSGSDPLEPTPGPGPEPEQQTVISFSGTMQDEESVAPNAQAAPATRAAQGLEEVLTNKTFQVWGYKNDAATGNEYTSYQAVMPNFTVNWGANTAYTTTSNTDDWEYVHQGATAAQQAEQTIKYWDFGALAYRFFGYALGNATTTPATLPAEVTVPDGFPTGNSTPTSAETVTFSAAVDASSDATIAAAPYFSHLWFSDGNPANYPDKQFGQPVQLQFLKPFARVRFLFTFVEGLNFGREKLSHIRFYPTKPATGPAPTIATAGTVSVTYPLQGTETTETWTTSNTTGINAFTIDYYETPSPVPDGYPVDAQAASWPNTPKKWYTVLPNASQGSYTLEVAVVSDEVKSVVIPAEYMSWKAGYEYTYKFKITETGGITMDIIQVAINDWGNKQSSQHTVYNW